MARDPLGGLYTLSAFARIARAKVFGGKAF
jgi:hypothetical protein